MIGRDTPGVGEYSTKVLEPEHKGLAFNRSLRFTKISLSSTPHPYINLNDPKSNQPVIGTEKRFGVSPFLNLKRSPGPGDYNTLNHCSISSKVNDMAKYPPPTASAR